MSTPSFPPPPPLPRPPSSSPTGGAKKTVDADVPSDAQDAKVAKETPRHPSADGAALASAAPIERIPDHIMCMVLELLDSKTLLISVPQVCKRWRIMCRGVRARFDFSWWAYKAVPVEVLGGLPPAYSSGGMRLSGLCQLFPGAVAVEFGYGQRVTDEHLIALRSCRRITAFILCGACSITDRGMDSLAHGRAAITDIDLENCDKLTDATVYTLAKHCPRITAVSFNKCFRLTDAALLTLAKKCSSIVTIDLRWVTRVTDQGMIAFAGEATKLQTIHLGYCYNLNGAAVIALVDGGVQVL